MDKHFLGPCQPGTYSTTAFEPCFACPLNTYQDRSTRKQCLKCPPGLYTWKVGSNSSSDCVGKSERNMINKVRKKHYKQSQKETR